MTVGSAIERSQVLWGAKQPEVIPSLALGQFGRISLREAGIEGAGQTRHGQPGSLAIPVPFRGMMPNGRPSHKEK